MPYFYGAAVDATTTRAQTFTARLDGLMDRMELQVWRQAGATALLIVQLRRTLPTGEPDTGPMGLLAAVRLSATAVPTTPSTQQFSGVDLGAQSFPVASGQRFAIVLSSANPTNTWYLWNTTQTKGTPPAPDYPRGIAFHTPTAGAPLSALPHEDSTFRTYVLVPEPCGLVTAMAVGLIAAFCRRPQRLNRLDRID